MKKNIKHFLLLTAAAAGSLHMANRFFNARAEMKNILKSESGNYFDWKNGKIFYKKRGSGSSVLLIHDLNPISSSYEWCRFAKKLEKNHTVYTLDLLGCGRSEKPYLTYTNYIYVQLITDFIKNIIGESPDVITTNTSISFVVLAENMNKNLIKNIIAINPPNINEFNRTPNKYSAVRKMLLELPVLGTFIYNIRTNESNIQKTLRQNYFYNSHLVSAKMLDAYFEASHMDFSHGKYLMASIEGNYTDNAIGHVLNKLEIPLHIIQSNQLTDAVSTASSYKKFNSKIETSYISYTGLVPQLEAPDKLLDMVNAILDK